MKDVSTLYEGINKTIYKTCHKYLPTATKHYMDFDDLVSLCNVYFMENYQSYDELKGASFNTYMTNVIERSLSKHFRDLGAKKRCFQGEIVRIDVPIDVKGDKPTSISEILPDKNDFLLDIECEQVLQEILNVVSLTKNGREVILLKVQGYTVGEIANILNTKPQNISNCLMTIKRLLRQNEII